MRYIITCGGTGGHIYPAISIADKLMEIDEKCEILFIGTEKGMESKIVPEHNYKIEFIKASGINRKKLMKNFKVIKETIEGSRQSKKIIENFKPDAVIGTGGYVTGAVVRKAHQMKIKTFIQEQNACAGMTNKLLSKYAMKIFLGFEEASKHFKHKEKLIYTGNPVRKEFFELNQKRMKNKIGENDDDFMVLCFGGSRGASKINETICEVIEKINNSSNISIHFVTGKIYYKMVKEKMQKINMKKIHIHEYIGEMNKYLGAADLVISRGGALSVAEITAAGKPSILIPSPNVTGNHQYFNAKSLADKAATVLVEEKDLNCDLIIKNIEMFCNDKKYRENISENAKNVSKIKATDKICHEIISCIT